MRPINLNLIKKHFLNRELLTLEYKVNRHYALSTRKAELETKQSNFFTKSWNQYQYNHVKPEYELLSKQLPLIKGRILEIKEQLRK